MDRNEMIEKMEAYLDKFKYEYSRAGVETIFDTWEKNKKDLYEKLRLHPNWDEKNLAIVLKNNEYERAFNGKAITEFRKWVDKRLDEIARENKVDHKNYDGAIDRLERISTKITDIYNYMKVINENTDKDFNIYIEINGETNPNVINEIIKEYSEKNKEQNHIEYDEITSYGTEWLNKDLYMELNGVHSALIYIENNAESDIVTKELAEGINERFNINAVEGQRLSRVINKICTKVGIDKYKEMKTMENGNERDFGYAREFALVADSINPYTYKRITVISINPLDYWGMSIGKKWQSCHTFDIHHVLNNEDESHHYNGCYSSGTESYMLDKSSIVYYVIDEHYEGDDYYTQLKMNRCMFCVNEDGNLLLESRVYPDGRDNGDKGLARQFRDVMQRTISLVYGKNNLWKLEKGSRVCRDYTITSGTHYKDYTEYDDGNISFNEEVDRENVKMIYIGHDPICPICGYEHDKSESIICDDCDGETVCCDHCGDRININEAIRTNDGNYYCDSDCAEADGYVRCEDDDEWYQEDEVYYCEDDGCYHKEDNCYKDEYDGYYYSGSPEIETSDGNYYHSEETAIEDGYEREYFSDEWMERDELYWDDYECVYFDADNDDAIETEDGNYYATESSAENAGYIKTENDEWIKEDDAIITEDGSVYASEEDANEDGWEKNEDGEWRLSA